MAISTIGTNGIENGAIVAADLAANAVTTTKIADANITQAKLAASVVGNGPAFAAYASANQILAGNTLTKVNIDTKIFDTNTNFSTSTGAYTPTVAGYYLFTGMYNSSAPMTGAIYGYFNNLGSGQNYQLCRSYFSSDYPAFNASMLLYMNGTTDSITFNVGTTTSSTSQGGLMFSRFSAVLVRAA